MIDEWAADVSLPLFIRKQGKESGSYLIHKATQRRLAPCDNSPAHWSIIAAFAFQTSMSLEKVREAIRDHEIATTMAMSNEDLLASDLQGCNSSSPYNATKRYGWRVDHIDPIGIGRRGRMEDLLYEDLVRHFKLLMQPSNMLLVPKGRGWGDLPELLNLARAERRALRPGSASMSQVVM